MAKKALPKVTCKQELPLALEPAHIRVILGSDKPMGERQLYEWLNEVEKTKEPPFRIVRVGRLMKIPRDSFFAWFEGQQQTS